ncbi:unnamed protein product [Phytomonas sp. Hart1]|nr:unnamed protein product [Phytomonas sp. Hart1]|eukprot:CCW65982.1 unnamed protein product [Phytomonas sp. isolate Hart1]
MARPHTTCTPPRSPKRTATRSIFDFPSSTTRPPHRRRSSRRVFCKSPMRPCSGGMSASYAMGPPAVARPTAWWGAIAVNLLRWRRRRRSRGGRGRVIA